MNWTKSFSLISCPTVAAAAAAFPNHHTGNSQADVWSAGVVLFRMVVGHLPMERADTSDWWFRALNVSLIVHARCHSNVALLRADSGCLPEPNCFKRFCQNPADQRVGEDP